MNLKKIVKTFAISMLLAVTSTTANAQDLLARQAPVDRKMAAVDTIMLRNITMREELESPSADLYANWDNKYAHRATELPETYKIDLRHFTMPTTSRVITSNFGSRWGRQHKGLDIKVYIGDTIRAAFSGKVRIVRYEAGGYGKYIVIRHNNGLETIYGHLSKQLVEENQEVRSGEVIGLGGNTGRSTGSHLHFETRLCGVALNPALMFDFRAQDVTGDYYAFNKETYDNESTNATRLRGKQDSSTYASTNSSDDYATNKRTTSGLTDQISYHKVKKGETLERIAKKRGVTIEKICKLNHITKTMRLRPGQILRYS
ncbi:MAG: peptidoglycan DD-metalloendopeptidase family protein [Prevotella sp.]|nr:peptidoglycan DD-metalloendopeptidase family protein [Prevotella sp.]MCI7495937.1 peptidoglycan DD-metalloendopeptidase family protein [Prevotella sp.]MCI7509725.1 peptidoglycan DD-metalloendopeptidase family protein [Prevotella sp.]MDY2772032.1 peptidoglycan DD-metalloendopeptidase family protein [Prevotella sp.]MDY2894790.1 peptidoglycan DD-metalloendopeptidase family protein [Prevotella sp.]